MDTKKVFPFLILFTSSATLICCALPALLVSIGLGAVMAGLASNIPGLVWVSEHKTQVFVVAGIALVVNGFWLWKQRNAPCPTDPKLRDACIKGRKFSLYVYGVSVGIFLVGAFFAFVAPYLN